MPKISVIVPVYNVEQYLETCVDSILMQTFADFELILVNDGSSDRSGELCDKYAEKDVRIRVIHKENGGQNSAVKAGLSVAESEYICFVDSDDWVEENMLEVLERCLITNDCDWVVSNAYRNSMTQTEFPLHFCEEGCYDQSDIHAKVYLSLLERMDVGGVRIAPSRCGKLFKKELLVKVLPYLREDVRFGEDKLLTYPYAALCSRIYFTDEKLYHYRDNPQSISYKFRKNSMEEQKWIISELTKALGALSEYDFGRQLEAATVRAVDITIGGIQTHLSRENRREMYHLLKAAVLDESVSTGVCPYAARKTERIKFQWIMKKRVRLLWMYVCFSNLRK